MKFQISFDLIDLDKALNIATQVAPYATSLEVGSLLLYKHGIKAVESFRQAFPDQTIFVDSKIVDRSKDVVTLLAKAGADWVSVMGGTSKNVIHTAAITAHNLNIKIMLDLLDASSLGQAALEAKGLEIDALLVHKPYEESNTLVFLDQWDMLRGNTSLPIFVSGRITRDVLDKILAIKPDGIIVGKTITDAENPASEAEYFYQKINEAS